MTITHVALDLICTGKRAVRILLECFLVTNLLCAFVVNRKMAFYKCPKTSPNKTSLNFRQIFPPLRMVYVRAENQFITIF